MKGKCIGTEFPIVIPILIESADTISFQGFKGCVDYGIEKKLFGAW